MTGAVVLLLALGAQAATITQDENLAALDSVGWLKASAWSNDQAPSPAHDYVNQTGGRDTRSPVNSVESSPTFLGNSLTITNGARLKAKHGGVCTISDLTIWAGSQVRNGGSAGSLAGNMALRGTGTVTFDSETGNRKLTISSLLTADPTVHTIRIAMSQTPWAAPANTAGFIMDHPGNVFEGTWDVSVGMLKGVGFGSGDFNVGALGYLDFESNFSNTNSVLTVLNGGKILLDQNVVVYSATIWGQALAAGTHSGADLKAHGTYGAAFDAASQDSATLTVTLGAPPPAPVITQTTTHGAGDALGWLNPATWSDGLAPSAGRDYLNNTLGMDTRPPQSSNPVFPGDSLTLTNGADFVTKHSGTATVSDLRIAAGCAIGLVSGTALAGNLALTGEGTVVLDAANHNRKLTISSLMTADPGIAAIDVVVLANWDTNAFKNTGFTITHPGNTFTGTWDVKGGYLKGSGFGSGSFKVHATGCLDFDSDFNGAASDLTILPGGLVLLDQDVTVGTATILGNLILAGTYTGAQLKAAYGSAFDPASLNGATLTVLYPEPSAAITWAGPDGGQWSMPTNWDLGRVPSFLDQIFVPFDHDLLAGDDVVLDGASLDYALTAGVHALRFMDGSSFTVQNGSTVDLVSAVSLVDSSDADDPTTWNIVGSTNTISTHRLFTDTNTTIRFTAGGGGVSAVTVDDRLHLRQGTALIVDLTGYDISNGTNLVLFSAAAAGADTGGFVRDFGSVTFLGDYAATLVGTDTATMSVSLVQPSMKPVMPGNVGPQTFTEAWAGYDPTVEPLNVEVLREWTEGGITLRVVRYDVGTFSTPFGGTQVSKMAAFYGFPTGASDLPAILHIHGGGGRASLDEVRYAAYNGYAGLSQNWLGNELEGATPGEPNTEWGSVDPRQVYHQSHFVTTEPDSRTIDRVKSVRNSNWFVLGIANRRGLTFLQQQPEVDPARLAVTGYSMGGEQAHYVAGSDARLLAAAPSVGGSGDMTAADIAATGLPGFDEDTSHDALSRESRSIGSFPFTTVPILYYGPLNDHNAPSDNLMYHYEHVIPTNTPRRFAMPPHLDHANLVENEIPAMLWFDQYLKGTYLVPDQPVVTVDLAGAATGPLVTVIADTSKPIVKVDVLYSVDELPVTRFWRAATDVQQTAPGVWQATCKNVVYGQPLFVLANVVYDYDHTSHTVIARGETTPYTGDYLLTSNLKQIPAQDLIDAGAWLVADGRKMLIDDFRRDWQDWRQSSWSSANNWSAVTLKPVDPLFAGSSGALLGLDVKTSSARTVLIGLIINDWHSFASGPNYTYYVEKSVSGSPGWQTITAAASEFRPTVAGAPALTDWSQVSSLELTARSKTVYNPGGSSETLSGSSWAIGDRQFGLLRWVTSEITWLGSYGLQPSDALVDNDGDGLVSRFEHAFDLNPMTPDRGAFDLVTLDPSGRLEAQYNELLPDVVYGTEISSDLLVGGSWAASGVSFIKDVFGGTVATDTTGPSSASEPRFMRLTTETVP